MKKIILHLCADLGSDSRYYQLDDNYEVIRVGIDIGVENYNPPTNVYGIIANPPCNEFSTAKCFTHIGNLEKGMLLVNHCLRIIEQCKPTFWVIENPANGRLKEFLGKPTFTYQPYQFGSPWTKKTSLWGKFNIPKIIYNNWNDVPKNNQLYIRPSRNKPSLALFHKNDVYKIPEFEFAIPYVKCDADIRSLCSQGFAKAFYEANL